jgi:hypothetical protein
MGQSIARTEKIALRPRWGFTKGRGIVVFILGERAGNHDSQSYQRGEGIMANLEYLDLGDEGRGKMNGLFF